MIGEDVGSMKFSESLTKELGVVISNGSKSMKLLMVLCVAADVLLVGAVVSACVLKVVGFLVELSISIVL